MAPEALTRRTLTMTAADLTGWVTESVTRLEPEAERDPPPVDTREGELAKVITKVRQNGAHNEMSKAAGELAGVTALQDGGDAVVRAGRLMRMDEALRARLQALHLAPPAGTQPAQPLPEETVANHPDTEEVYKALRSFARSTGLGPSGFPVQVLKSLCTRVGAGVDAEDS
jgi:hypothetical protein